MFEWVTSISSTISNLHSKDSPCHVHGGKPSLILLCFFNKKQIPLKQVLHQSCYFVGQTTWEDASLTILVSLRPESTTIYLTSSHNMNFLLLPSNSLSTISVSIHLPWVGIWLCITSTVYKKNECFCKGCIRSLQVLN